MKFLKVVSMMLMGLSFALVVCELAVRLFVPSDFWSFRDATDDWIADPVFGYRQKPNINTHYQGVHYTTNTDGIQPDSATRDRDVSKFRVMVIGGSVGTGRWLQEDERLHRALERTLMDKGLKVEVLNGSVQGHSPEQTYLILNELLELYRPDLVIYGYAGTFIGATPREYTLGEEGNVIIADQGPMQIGQFKSGKFLKDTLRHSALLRLISPYLHVFRLAFADEAELHQMGVSSQPYTHKAFLDALDWESAMLILKSMHKLANTHASKFLYFTQPMPIEVWDPYVEQIIPKGESMDFYAIESKLKTLSDKNSIHYVPLIEYFRNHSGRGPFHLLPKDPHCNRAGFQLIAERVADYVHTHGLLNE